jgi:glutaminyl-tRNA synthetase
MIPIPPKEEQEYVDAIKEDLQWFGFSMGRRTLFQTIFQHCMNGSEDDVKDGKAMLIVNCCSYV